MNILIVDDHPLTCSPDTELDEADHHRASRQNEPDGPGVHRFDLAARLADEGKSPLYAALDGKLAAILAVADPVKATTPQAIKALHALGLKVAMITGDNARTAQAIMSAADEMLCGQHDVAPHLGLASGDAGEVAEPRACQ